MYPVWIQAAEEKADPRSEITRLLGAAQNFRDEEPSVSILNLGSGSDRSLRGRNVYISAECEASDQIWTETDRLSEDLYWSGVRETAGRQAVSGQVLHTLQII